MSDWRPEAAEFLRRNATDFLKQATRCCWLNEIPHLAEDVLRDAIKKLLEKWPNELILADEDHRRGHMFITIRLLSQNAGARAVTERKHHAGCLDDPDTKPSVTDGVSAEDVVMGIIAREQLYTAIRGLRPLQREVIEMGKLGGLSCNEIAQKLSISPSAVTSNMQRAMKNLRATVSPELLRDLEKTHSTFMLSKEGGVA